MPKCPNILQITTHDSGRHIGCYGHPTLHTPALDAFAAEGVRMTNYFAAAPICCASRATQLTGLEPQRHGLLDLCFSSFDWRLRDDVKHMSHRMKAAGYETHLFGIQHEVDHSEIGRLDFDAMIQPKCGGGVESAGGIAEAVAAFLRDRPAGAPPFYAQVGFFETHTPFDFDGTPPDTEHGLEIPSYMADEELSRRAMAGYQSSIRKVDAAFATIREALGASGLEDDTLLVFTTDHGIEMPRAKWTLYDSGLAIALLVRYPAGGVSGGRTVDELLGNVDYLPTLLDLAGLDVPGGLDGKSFATALRGEGAAGVREAVFGMYHKTASRCVRTDRFRLIRHFDAPVDFYRLPVRIEEVMQKRALPRVELYDLEADPNQFENVADREACADERRRLEDMLWRWMVEVNDPLLAGPVRTPAYEASMRDYAAWRGGGA